MIDHLSVKELFIRFTARAFGKLLSICVFSYFPFEGRMWDLIVLVPDLCLSFYFGAFEIEIRRPGKESTYLTLLTRPGSWVGCASDWHAGGRGFGNILSWRLVISTAILSIPLIQVGQLSVTGEGMCT